MTTFADMVYALGGIPLLAGIPFGRNSKAYFVDPANGNNADDGESPQTAVASIATAYAKTTNNNNDIVFFIGGPTGDALTSSLTWSNSYTHLIGISPSISMGQRCRVTGDTTADLATLVTFSGSGCLVRNIQFFNGTDVGTAAGAAVVSGARNLFEFCFFAGMGHATNGAVAGSYSLTVSGAENTVRECHIGIDTIIRAAANSELIVSGARNTFEKCMIESYSETAGKFLVKIDNSGGDLRWTKFIDCTFYNYTVNWATGITNAFSMPAGGSTHDVLLIGKNYLQKGATWADNLTHIYSAEPASNAGFGISLNPTS